MRDLTHIRFEGTELAPRNRQRFGNGIESHCQPKPECAVRTTAEADPFLSLILLKAGLDPRVYKYGPMQRRIPSCLRALNVSSTQQAAALLKQARTTVESSLNALLIGVTDFFREPAVFDYLRSFAIPELLQHRSGLRVYSAGSSEGQELYSVAMLLDLAGALEQSFLLGVDCRPDAVARARVGRYEVQALHRVEPALRQRYFSRAGLDAVISPALRAKLQWQVADLFSFDPGQVFDLILFRNVAIYLSERAAPVWARLVTQLQPGGFLVTGKAEKPPRELPLVRVANCIYKRGN